MDHNATDQQKLIFFCIFPGWFFDGNKEHTFSDSKTVAKSSVKAKNSRISSDTDHVFFNRYGSFLASKDPEIIPSSIHFCSHLCSVTDMWFHPQERKTWFLRGFLGLEKEKSWYWFLSYFININHDTLWWLNMSFGNARAQRTFIAGNINSGFVSKHHVINMFDGTRRYPPLISWNRGTPKSFILFSDFPL